jgi:hypothetical protein
MTGDVFGSTLFIEYANCENHCGAAAFCNIDNHRSRFFAHHLQRRANAFWCCRRARVARRASSRKHFLKRDDVFFDVLVYSGCSAFRFPSARSD